MWWVHIRSILRIPYCGHTLQVFFFFISNAVSLLRTFTLRWFIWSSSDLYRTYVYTFVHTYTLCTYTGSFFVVVLSFWIFVLYTWNCTKTHTYTGYKRFVHRATTNFCTFGAKIDFRLQCVTIINTYGIWMYWKKKKNPNRLRVSPTF